ncbi:hypothetical protein [Pimelobacter simplex]|uniref:hypothetical protein n=1 Tax=Nocardioides simplex TaxID=2045 RepID=UPI003AB0122E
MTPRRRAARAHDERGASAVLIAALMAVVLMVSAAFAVDLGQQRVVRRDVQAVADMVALDMVRLLDGSAAKDYSTAVFDNARNNSLDRNDSAMGGKLAPSDVSWSFAKRDAGTWAEIANSSTDVPTAIIVKARSSVGFAFSGFTGVGRGAANRTAVARNEETACLVVGSFIASLDSAQGTLLNPILNGLLGGNLNLDLVSYKGLAGANVSLLDLVKVGGLNVGTVDELLALENVEVAKLFIAAANVLEQQGKLAQANILRAIKVAASTPTIAIADLLDVEPGSSAALNAALNVLDLVTTAAFVANDKHAVDIPNLGINLSPLASVKTTLTVIEPPQAACGPVGIAKASSAQIRLTVSAKVPARSINVGILGLANVGVSLDEMNVNLSVDLGAAEALLTEVHCNAAGPDYVRAKLSSSVLGATNLSVSLGAHVLVTVPLLGSGGLLGQILNLLGLGSLLNPPEIKLDTGLSLGASSPGATNFSKDLVLPIPGSYTVPVGSGSGAILGPLSASVSGTTKMSVIYGLFGDQVRTVLNADPLFNTVLSPVLSGVVGLLNPLVTQLQQALITPLSDMLGLQLGGADVFSVEAPTCKGPKLVG